MLEPRRLLTFREVARRGSFSRAAEALALTQPAVSQQIAALEREVGGPCSTAAPEGSRSPRPARCCSPTPTRCRTACRRPTRSSPSSAGAREARLVVGAYPERPGDDRARRDRPLARRAGRGGPRDDDRGARDGLDGRRRRDPRRPPARRRLLRGRRRAAPRAPGRAAATRSPASRWTPPSGPITPSPAAAASRSPRSRTTRGRRRRASTSCAARASPPASSRASTTSRATRSRSPGSSARASPCSLTPAPARGPPRGRPHDRAHGRAPSRRHLRAHARGRRRGSGRCGSSRRCGPPPGSGCEGDAPSGAGRPRT